MTTHPTDFYIAHHLYSGRAFPNGPVWGCLTDGPEELSEVLDRLRDLSIGPHVMTNDIPSLENVRIWHFQDDVPARDVTEDVLQLLNDQNDVEWME